ncbi:MAG TPA: hydrogenase maturation protease [Blastocatellia bacterium]|nr:hydrogenase maturation protease [Blastocatellia bacterium]
MERFFDSATRIGVIGIGNVLMGDDAFGPYVIQVLSSSYVFPDNVSLMDLGTPSLDLVAYVEDLDAAIILDSVHSKGVAGELRIYDREEILRHPIQPRISPHEPGLKEALLIAEFDGRGPRDALLIGVIPETTATGVGLSPPVRNSVPEAIKIVLGELERLGAKAFPLLDPATPRIWWEQHGASSAG